MHGAVPPFPQYVLMERCLVKRRDNFMKDVVYRTQFIWAVSVTVDWELTTNLSSSK
jgi:hypothetical protein